MRTDEIDFMRSCQIKSADGERPAQFVIYGMTANQALDRFEEVVTSLARRRPFIAGASLSPPAPLHREFAKEAPVVEVKRGQIADWDYRI